MQKFMPKTLLLMGAIFAIDPLIPGVHSGELVLQAGLVALYGALMHFRQ